MATFRETLKQAILGLGYAELVTTPVIQGGPGATQAQSIAEVRQAIKRRIIRVPLTDGGTAGTAVAETTVDFAMPDLSGGIMVVAAFFIPQITVAQNAANALTLNIFRRTNGAGQVTIATNSTLTADANWGVAGLTAFKASPAMTITAANATLAVGTDVITVSVTKPGTGAAFALATGASYLNIEVEEL